MRILWDNIIDGLTATSVSAYSEITSYSAINVQDERLGKRWKSDTSATAQTVTFTFDTLPDYPDASASTIYANHFATADSWVATGGVATTGTIVGVMRLTATTAASSMTRSGLAIPSGKTVIGRFRSPSVLATTLTIYRGASSVAVITGVSTSYSTYTAVIAGGSAATTLTVAGNNTASTGTVFDMDFLYVGDGTYTTTLVDNSGNGNHGTIYGATPVEGVSGRALSFDGTNDYINTPANSFSLTSDSDVSFSCRIKIPTSFTWDTSNRLLVFGLGTGAGSIGIEMALSNNIVAGAIREGGATRETGGSAISRDTWYHCAFVFTTSDKRGTFYLNGVADSNSTVAISAGVSFGTYMSLGGVSVITGTASYAEMYADDLRIYSRALSADEVGHLNSMEPWLGEDDGLCGKWKVDDGLLVNSAAVLGHNVKTGTLVKVQGDASGNWTDPDVSETMTVNPETILKFLSTGYVKKYWRFYFYGQASIEVGRMWLGEYMTVDPSSLTGFSVEKMNSDIVEHGRHRQKFATPGVTWRRIGLQFPRSDEEMVYKISEMYDEIGNHSSVIFCNFDTIRDYALVEPVYCSIVGPVSFSNADRMGWTYSLDLEEEL